MTAQPNLGQLTTLLSECLGRIDAQAFELQRAGETDDLPSGADDVLTHEATELQELVRSLLATGALESCNLNGVLGRVLTQCLRGLPGPLLVRQRVDPDLPLVGCNREGLAAAVQRALLLAGNHLAIGDELRIDTRVEGQQVLLELEACGGSHDPDLAARAQTLCEFVANLPGHCRVEQDAQHHLLIAFELPLATVDNTAGTPSDRQ
jgi:hypothetical protein